MKSRRYEEDIGKNQFLNIFWASLFDLPSSVFLLRRAIAQVEVLQQVSKGLSNREIAKTLHISTATVKTHLIHIFGKLGVDDRTAAVTVALEREIIHLNR